MCKRHPQRCSIARLWRLLFPTVAETRDVIEAMQLAKSSGSPVVTVTRSGSPLERLADLNLNVEVPEDSDVFSPLKSRLAQMVVLDILAVGVALRGGDKMIERLARATLAIADNFVEA